MEVNTISELFKHRDPVGQWGEFITTPELYMERGKEYVVRLVGPSYKAKRCYISRGNLAITNSPPGFLKNLLNGKDVLSEINLSRIPESLNHEVVIANDQSLWTKCLAVSCVLIRLGRRHSHEKVGELHHLVLSSSGVASLIQLTKSHPAACLSGAFAHDLIIRKSQQRMGPTRVSISSEKTFLKKKAITTLLNEGIPDAKEFYLEQNRKNISKKGGYFYSFYGNKVKSSLDKHLEPLQKIENYFEEDKQHDYIHSNPKKVIELEGVEAFDFIDVE